MADDELTTPGTASPVPAGDPSTAEPVPAAAEAVGGDETAPPPDAPRPPGLGRRVTVVSLRVARGLGGLAAAAAVVAAVGLVPLPEAGIEPLGTVVEPEAADLLSVCPGALLRLGDETGGNAGRVFPVGAPDVVVASQPADTQRIPLLGGDAAGSSAGQEPVAVRLVPSEDAAVAAAQGQYADGAGELSGLAAAACAEPVSSAWIAAGSTTLGRTSILQLVNPTAVRADVTLELWGEDGRVSAPGMSGIMVPAGGRLALPLSGFAPDLASPVVHVEARGGQVVAWLQTSIIRVIEPGGVDLVGPGVAPAEQLVIPGVRIQDSRAVAGSLGIEGYDDLEAVIRIGNPGDTVARVEVSLTPANPEGVPTSFEVSVAGGGVSDTPLASAHELGEEPLPDGVYTVAVRSDVPVVAAARASTITPPTAGDAGPVPGAADIAWFSSAAPLTGDTAFAVAAAGSPVLVAVALDGAPHTLVLESLGGGGELALDVPATGSVAIPLSAGAAYRIRDADGVAAAVSFAGPGRLAGYPVVSPRASDGPLVVRP